MIAAVKTRIKKIFASLALLSFEFIVVSVIFFAALLLFLAMAKMIFLEDKKDFDQRAFDFLGGFISNAATDFMLFFTYLGTHTFLIPANLVLIFYFLFIRKHRWYSIKIPVIAVSSVLLMFMLKFIFSRPRPLIPLLKEAQGFSFPSGHALNSVAFYGLMIYLVWQNIKRPVLKWILVCTFLLVILFIGLSRVYLRVHYASDVLAGFAMGFMWLLLSITVLKRIELYSKKEIEPVIEQSEDDPVKE
jgi:membrane-associated phospholipid phosphatase